MNNKLEIYKTIEIAVNGSSEELALRLHKMGDYSQVITVSLKVRNKILSKQNQKFTLCLALYKLLLE